MKMHTCSTFWSISTVILCVSLRFYRKEERRRKNKQKKQNSRHERENEQQEKSVPLFVTRARRSGSRESLYYSSRIASFRRSPRHEMKKAEKRKIETTQNYMSEKNNTGSRERETSAYIIHTLPWLYPGYKKGYKRVGVSFSLHSPSLDPSWLFNANALVSSYIYSVQGHHERLQFESTLVRWLFSQVDRSKR